LTITGVENGDAVFAPGALWMKWREHGVFRS
jgi:hypothetical protein